MITLTGFNHFHMVLALSFLGIDFNSWLRLYVIVSGKQKTTSNVAKPARPVCHQKMTRQL